MFEPGSSEYISMVYRAAVNIDLDLKNMPLYWEEHDQPYDFWRFTRFSLEKMLLDTGCRKHRDKTDQRQMGNFWNASGRAASLFGLFRKTSLILDMEVLCGWTRSFCRFICLGNRQQ